MKQSCGKNKSGTNHGAETRWEVMDTRKRGQRKVVTEESRVLRAVTGQGEKDKTKDNIVSEKMTGRIKRCRRGNTPVVKSQIRL